MENFSISGICIEWFQKSRKGAHLAALFSLLGLSGGAALLHAGDYPSGFSWQNGITNTRHNMSQRSPSYDISGAMITVRNNYGEVCVYCHTPHGANENITAPLWNRTIKSNTYQTYDQLGTTTMTAKVNQPGVNSITCLSCHDGTVAIDSIINMPGSGSNRYSAAGKSSHQESFLDNWVTVAGKTTKSNLHYAIGNSSPASGGGCMVCHSGPDGMETATDFTVFVIGTDLRNDHPVGVELPTERVGMDFNDATADRALMRYYDKDGDSRADPGEIRYYKSGDTFRVECASCHDPHGVVTGGGSIIPSFLRVSNNNSGVCLTCHSK